MNTRKPTLTITPSSVTPGGRVHISATGFAPGATLAFTVTGQAGFSVTAPGGLFAWDVVVPASATAGVVTVQASASNSTDTASASYTVTSVAQLRPSLTIVSGNDQTGAPGGVLPGALVAALTDRMEMQCPECR